MNEKYLRTKEVCEMLNISDKTLLRWDNEGKVKSVRTKGGHRRYLLSDITGGCIVDVKTQNIRRKICYCRVSSHGQKEDLETQKKYLSSKYPDHEVISDIGSGLNFNRKGFNSILESAIRGNIEEIVVSHRDRLCRFGFDLVERIISTWSNGKILVLDKGETSPEKELVDDLISIVTVFSDRIYGLRSHTLKRQIRECANIENADISDGGSEEKPEVDV
jgi:excisionase family DNA binding protein